MSKGWKNLIRPPQVVLEVWITGLVGSLAPLGRGGLAGRRGAVENLSGLRPAPNNGSYVVVIY